MDEVAGGSELDLDGFVIYSILFNLFYLFYSIYLLSNLRSVE